ncbi:MAG TPA: hemin uptake protein HemP [Rhodanobacteraceae bacterium]|jgi:hemin uptake protein HemP|nr:hemin uptake protein HemP [Rhodanobacteraceae bacterium]
MLDPVPHEPSAALPRANRATSTPAPNGAQRIDSHRLLAGGRELVIDHAGQEYRLRLTRNDKLILTK